MTSHLIVSDGKLDDNNYWTNVFSRDMQDGLSVQVQPIGPDLIFDVSLRNTMSYQTDHAGSVVFSPYMFKVVDLPKDLESGVLPALELMKLGHVATKAKSRFMNGPT